MKSSCSRRCRKGHSSTARPWWRKSGIVKWYVVVIVSDWRCWFTFGVDDDGLVMVAKVNLTAVPDIKYGKDYNVSGAPLV